MADYIKKFIETVVIGAGPSGSLAARLLQQQGLEVEVFEKQHFPRFVIGESLLPQSMQYLERGHLLQSVVEAGFQHKNGANFYFPDCNSSIDFRKKFEEGWGTTYQVQREKFDKILADEVVKGGVPIHYGHSVDSVKETEEGMVLFISNETGEKFEIETKYVLDASGYGRVLPRLLNLEQPSDFPMRHAFFTHVKDNLESKDFDRNKILITVSPEDHNTWYWLIPFSNGTSSLGVILPPERTKRDISHSVQLWSAVKEAPKLHTLVEDAEELRMPGEIAGYSCAVKHLATDRYALLGNAGEFLDPVFSSGVTIALKSADLAAPLVKKQISGEKVDWTKEYAAPLKNGVDCFKAFVTAWYDGRLQKIIKYPPQDDNQIKRMIVSILGGYAWNEDNPFVRQPTKYLDMVAEQCAPY
ncbi:NAD(P)/FAD-dependent oxidoreductase [Curvivirga sp.]|uniref:NAD(P)/FAD-dependent oxidoreductase n=1 Tax=Curvivirga sp. TaxID=2856848 RepID=UPI003B5AA496